MKFRTIVTYLLAWLWLASLLLGFICLVIGGFVSLFFAEPISIMDMLTQKQNPQVLAIGLLSLFVVQVVTWLAFNHIKRCDHATAQEMRKRGKEVQ